MNTSRKIQIALGTILLWSSTSVSSFAATNTITPGKLNSVTVKIPVETIPSRQLNLRQDTNLIAGQIRYIMTRVPQVNDAFNKFDEIWKNPADRQKRLFDYCNSQKDFSTSNCFNFIKMWALDLTDDSNRNDLSELYNVIDAVIAMKK